MNEEYQSIMKNGVWEVVPRPEDKSMLTPKWLYKIKHAVDGSIDKYKARFVARGFSQQEGIDYEEKFSPTASYTTICSLVSLAASMGWNIHQMDVKSVVINEYLQEYVYMTQPLGFEIEGQEHKVCKLIKALYGLKQVPRSWYAKMDKYLWEVGFQQSESDDTLYVCQQGKNMVILVMYVDDLIITRNINDHILQVKELQVGFRMIDLGLLHYYLGVEVFQHPNHIFIFQSRYVS